MTANQTAARATKPRVTNVRRAPPPDSMVLFEKLAAEQWLRAMMEISQEITKFTQTRLQEEATAGFALLGCKTPSESLECQQRFVERAVEQYQTEMFKLAQIVGLAGKGTPAEKHGNAS